MNLKHRLPLHTHCILVLALFVLCLPLAHAQVAISSGPGRSIPDAPMVSQLAPLQTAPLQSAPPPAQAPEGSSPVSPQPGSAPEGPPLTRAQAEQMAIRQNPNIRIGQLLALAEHQVVRETRSAELPQFAGSLTAQDAEEGSRVASGSLSASRLFTRAGGSIYFSQLLTDFGRTGNLVASSKLREMAQRSNAQATVEDIVVATDQAFYNTLQAQAVLEVARQTVAVTADHAEPGDPAHEE